MASSDNAAAAFVKCIILTFAWRFGQAKVFHEWEMGLILAVSRKKNVRLYTTRE